MKKKEEREKRSGNNEPQSSLRRGRHLHLCVQNKTSCQRNDNVCMLMWYLYPYSRCYLSGNISRRELRKVCVKGKYVYVCVSEGKQLWKIGHRKCHHISKKGEERRKRHETSWNMKNKRKAMTASSSQRKGNGEWGRSENRRKMSKKKAMSKGI